MKTIRLLSTYSGYKPNTILTLDDALADRLLSGGVNATLDLTGGTTPTPVAEQNLRRMTGMLVRANGTVAGFEGPDGSVMPFQTQFHSEHYFAHYFAGDQRATDPKLYDLLGSAHGTFGANLSVAEAWANPGYVTTKDPVTGTVNTSILMPPLAWDWAGINGKGGESLLLFWQGIVTPEGANTPMLGQSSAAAQVGPMWRAQTTGQVQTILNGGGTSQIFGPSTPNGGSYPLVAGQEHSFAFAYDPVARNCRVFVDGEYINTIALASLNVYNDTVPLRLGSSSPLPDTNGIATRTRALVILKGRFNQGLPGNINTTVSQLHANPRRLVSAGGW